jgi:hypothetical protein
MRSGVVMGAPQTGGRDRRRRRRGVWRAVAGLVAAAVVVVMAAAVASVRPLLAAHHDLAEARGALQSATSLDLATLASRGGRSAAEQAASSAATDAAAAQSRLDGSWGLDVLRFVPWASDQRDATVTLAADVQSGSTVALGLLRAADRFEAQAQAPSERGRIPLAGIAQLARAATRAGTALRALEHSPTLLLLPPLAHARTQLNQVAAAAAAKLSGTGTTLDALDRFLGAARPQFDLVAVENNAEMRDQGIITSFATTTFSGGRIHLGPHGSVADLLLRRPVDVALPAGTRTYFGDLGPAQLWQSVNATADFPLSGRLMRAMYAAATGRQVNGVIGIDVPALADILSVTGPVRVPGLAAPLGAPNAVPALLDQLYQRYPLGSQTPDRRAELSQVVRAVFRRLQGGGYDPVALGEALTRAVAGGHLQLYSATPGLERILSSQALSGAPAWTLPSRTFHLAVENATATKLDYFVRPRVGMAVRLRPDGSAIVTTSVSVVNTAPAEAQPSYQFGPQQYQARAGQYLARVYLWSPAGSYQPHGLPESGLELAERNVVANPATTSTVAFTATLPHAVSGGRLVLRLVPQPRAFPVPLTLSLQAPGWRLQGLPPTTTWLWDHTLKLVWAAHRG